jgi:hypothetical protein
MRVFSVLLDNTENYDFLGVFASQEDADAFIRRQEGFVRGWYAYGIVASELGEEVDFLGAVDWDWVHPGAVNV